MNEYQLYEFDEKPISENQLKIDELAVELTSSVQNLTRSTVDVEDGVTLKKYS